MAYLPFDEARLMLEEAISAYNDAWVLGVDVEEMQLLYDNVVRRCNFLLGRDFTRAHLIYADWRDGYPYIAGIELEQHIMEKIMFWD